MFDQIAFFKNKHVQVSPEKKVTQLTKYMIINEAKNETVERIPPYLYMAQHTFFNSPITKNFKSFHRTKHIFALNNHLPIRCVSFLSVNQTTNCRNRMINQKQSILAHYRDKTEFKCKTAKHCAISVDKTILKYYDRLKESVGHQLENIFD